MTEDTVRRWIAHALADGWTRRAADNGTVLLVHPAGFEARCVVAARARIELTGPPCGSAERLPIDAPDRYDLPVIHHCYQLARRARGWGP